MEVHREAVLLVPGMNGTVRHRQRDRLAEGLRVVPDDRIVERLPDGPDGSDGAVTLAVDRDGARWHLDVEEVFWGDLRPSLTDRTLAGRVVGGAALLAYWLPVVGSFRIRRQRGRFMLVSAVVSALLLLAWYVSVLGLAVQSARSIEGVDALVAGMEEWPLGTGGWIKAVVVDASLGLFVASGVLMGGLPVARLVEMAHVARSYLRRATGEGGAPGFRDACTNRVKEAVHRALSQGRYDRVTVVGHSFGATIAADVLSTMPVEDGGPELRLVTLGGTLEVSALRAPWLHSDIRRCLERAEVDVWHDLWADTDWLCAATPVPEGLEDRIEVEKVQHRAGWVAQVTGQTHDHYFTHPRVVELLLA